MRQDVGTNYRGRNELYHPLKVIQFMILRLQSTGHFNKNPKHRKQNHTHTHKEKKTITNPHISKEQSLPSILIKDCNLNEIKLLDIQLQSK